MQSHSEQVPKGQAHPSRVREATAVSRIIRMLKAGTTLEPSAQEQNGVSERMGRTIMDMKRSTLVGGKIRDDPMAPKSCQEFSDQQNHARMEGQG